jgi:hypothetical protein
MYRLTPPCTVLLPPHRSDAVTADLLNDLSLVYTELSIGTEINNPGCFLTNESHLNITVNLFLLEIGLK